MEAATRSARALGGVSFDWLMWTLQVPHARCVAFEAHAVAFSVFTETQLRDRFLVCKPFHCSSDSENLAAKELR